MKAKDPPIVVEQAFNVTMEKLWGALTDRDQRESCIAGWDYFIRKRLKDYLISKHE